MSLVVASLLWDSNRHSKAFSQAYDETWVERLHRGFARNLSLPFEFVLFTDRERAFDVPVTQHRLSSPEPGYGHCIEPYKLGRPMILVGLDTIITGNIDHLADYCFTAERVAVPLDPYFPHQVCNGVALVPAGQERIGNEWAGQNDMEWIRRFDPDVIDHLWPEHVVSYKCHVEKRGLGDARIVYFHGPRKMNEAPVRDLDWVKEHWR